MADRTIICPPNYMAEISGIKWIEVGTRKAWCIMETMTFTIPRSALPVELPSSYLELSEYCYEAVKNGLAFSCRHRGLTA